MRVLFLQRRSVRWLTFASLRRSLSDSDKVNYG
jgi:hypothetical protein